MFGKRTFFGKEFCFCRCGYTHKLMFVFVAVGHGNEAGHSTPKRVEGLVGLAVSQIACGSRHTAIVTAQGALYSWGDKENGVAGHGDVQGHQYTPRLVERLAGKKVVQLSVR